MKARLWARLQKLEAQPAAAQASVFRYGWLKPLPDDCAGERHVVMVKRVPTRSPSGRLPNCRYWRSGMWTATPSIPNEISGNHRRPQRVNICVGFLGSFNAPGTAQQVVPQGGQVGFFYYHSEAVAFQIVIGNIDTSKGSRAAGSRHLSDLRLMASPRTRSHGPT
jgi:hypothetical protein